MTIFEIAIETLFSATESCGGVGCVIYGLLDDDAAPDYGIELAAHLPEPAGAFGTLAVAIEALTALHEDILPGDHVDVALPAGMGALTSEALQSSGAADLLEQFTGEIASLRDGGVSVRVTGHDRANGDSLRRASALADLAVDARALAAYAPKDL